VYVKDRRIQLYDPVAGEDGPGIPWLRRMENLFKDSYGPGEWTMVPTDRSITPQGSGK